MRREFDKTLAPGRVCRIGYWQGYVTGQYYAYERESGRVFLSSAPFRTWTLRHGDLAKQGLPAERSALEWLVGELEDLGWRAAEEDLSRYSLPTELAEESPDPVNGKPELISEEAILGALHRIGGNSGATAAEVGRALLGDEASGVRHLPQRVAAKLRRLQLQGKVERRENGGRAASWIPLRPYPQRVTPRRMTMRRGRSAPSIHTETGTQRGPVDRMPPDQKVTG